MQFEELNALVITLCLKYFKHKKQIIQQEKRKTLYLKHNTK